MIRDHQDIVLMADCKRVSKGLKSENMGDINLWGHEHPPTLQQRLDQMHEECSYLRGRLQSLPYDCVFQLHIDLKYFLQLVTTKIRDICMTKLQERRRLMNYKKCNPDPAFKASAKGACKAHIYECKTFITNALQLNQSICRSMSLLQNTGCCFKPQNTNLQNMLNVRRLHPPEYVAQHTTVHHHPEWFKQLSPQWRYLRSKAHITSSTAYNALGFRGLTQLRYHFCEYIYKKGPTPVDASTEQCMRHGREHEVSAMLFCTDLLCIKLWTYILSSSL